jgi:hypothetical protein
MHLFSRVVPDYLIIVFNELETLLYDGQEEREQSTGKGEGACLQESGRSPFGKRYRLVEP